MLNLDRDYPTDCDRDDAALIDHWTHRDAELALRAQVELEQELLATEEFIAWQMARVDADREIESARQEAA
jgi:hypothetical protein